MEKIDTPGKKSAKCMNRQFIKEEMQVANKSTLRCSTNLINLPIRHRWLKKQWQSNMVAMTQKMSAHNLLVGRKTNATCRMQISYGSAIRLLESDDKGMTI